MNAGTTAPVIKLQSVAKVFLTDEVETHALSDVNLDVARGEYVSIAGPSGCGKSTLLSILGLLDSASSGEYWLNGQAVADLPAKDRARVRRSLVAIPRYVSGSSTFSKTVRSPIRLKL